MAFPESSLLDFTIEFAFGADLTTDSATWAWTDCSDRLYQDQQPELEIGARSEGLTTDSATVTLLLLNNDGEFTLGNPESSLYPHFDTDTPCRLLVNDVPTYTGSVAASKLRFPDQDLSRPEAGEAAVWAGDPALWGGDPIVWGTGGFAQGGLCLAEITVAGQFRRTSQHNKALKSALRRQHVFKSEGGGVTRYYPMEDGADATAFASGLIVPGRSAERVDSLVEWGWTLAADDSLVGSDSLPTVAAGGNAGWALDLGDEGPTDTWGLCQFLKIPEQLDDFSQQIVISEMLSDGTLGRVKLYLDFRAEGPQGGCRIVREFYDSTGQPIHASVLLQPDHGPAGIFRADTWLLWRQIVNLSGGYAQHSYAWRFVSGPSTSFWGSGSYVATGYNFGQLRSVSGSVTNAPSGGVSIGHLSLLDGSLLDGSWLRGPDDGWRNERCDARIERLFTEEKTPIEIERVTTTDCPKMGPQATGDLLDIVGEAAATDMGILREQRNGNGYHYKTRRARYNRPVVWVLDALAGEIQPPFEPLKDDIAIRNESTVTNKSGGQVTQSDPDSQAAHGLYDDSSPVNVSDPSTLPHQAGWRIWLGVQEGFRVAEVTVDFGSIPEARRAAHLASWVALAPGDRINVLNLPPQIRWPDPLTFDRPGVLDLLVLGWRELPTPTSHKAVLNCVPAKPWDVAEWVNSRYHPRDSYLNADITASATSVVVHTPGRRWTVTPAHFPFYGRIGDEQVQITNIVGSGADSGINQTFTLVRNINGLARAHPAGTDIRPWDKSILGE
jgi:hypothetical protein